MEGGEHPPRRPRAAAMPRWEMTHFLLKEHRSSGVTQCGLIPATAACAGSRGPRGAERPGQRWGPRALPWEHGTAPSVGSSSGFMVGARKGSRGVQVPKSKTKLPKATRQLLQPWQRGKEAQQGAHF